MKWLKDAYEFLYPTSARVQVLVGATGVKPEVRGPSLLFSWRGPLIVQQMLHPEQAGGTQVFALDVWVTLPDDHAGILFPVSTEWQKGRIMSMPQLLRPGWAGEVTVTVFNSHPEEASALPTGAPGFELLLLPVARGVCQIDIQ